MKNTENKEQHFVDEACPIKHIDDHNYLVLQIGDRTLYTGAIRVPGIDILNYKGSDQQICMLAYGDAVLLTEAENKSVFIGCHPDFTEQCKWLGQHEVSQADPHLQNILTWQRHTIEWWSANHEERRSYVVFYAEDKEKVDAAVMQYIRHLKHAGITVKICDEHDYVMLYEALLQGGKIQYAKQKKPDSKKQTA